MYQLQCTSSSKAGQNNASPLFSTFLTLRHSLTDDTMDPLANTVSDTPELFSSHFFHQKSTLTRFCPCFHKYGYLALPSTGLTERNGSKIYLGQPFAIFCWVQFESILFLSKQPTPKKFAKLRPSLIGASLTKISIQNFPFHKVSCLGQEH